MFFIRLILSKRTRVRRFHSTFMTVTCNPAPELPDFLKPKWQTLKTVLSPYPQPALAFSGGVDSSFLAWFLVHVMRKPAIGYHVLTPFLAARDRQETRHMGRSIGLPLEEVPLDILSLPEVRNNPEDRCYHCKRAIMGRLKKISTGRGCSVLLDGSQSDDTRQVRPGRRALQEIGVLSPLALAGFGKEDIREAGRLVSLPGWDRPSQSCLATRIPYDTPITPLLLARIEEAEDFLQGKGCAGVRVRVHGDLARIEGGTGVWDLLSSIAARDEIVRRFILLGFKHVTLDLAGYRSGCWDRHPEVTAGQMENTP